MSIFSEGVPGSHGWVGDIRLVGLELQLCIFLFIIIILVLVVLETTL